MTKILSNLRKIASGVSGDIFIILALPLLLLCVNQDWIFTNQGLVDPWLYLGYFLNLTHHLQTFVGTYYGSRLPFILPGYLIYHLFPPLIANYVFHLSFYYAAVIALYLILKATVSRRVALFAAILMGYHPYFLGAVGWDYLDGAGIAYFILTMLMLTLAAQSERWKMWLGLAGVCYGALIYTNLFLISFTPILVIYYLFTNRERRKNSIPTSLIVFCIGLVGLTLLLGGINYTINGEFLFFLTSAEFASLYTSQPNLYKSASQAWINNAYWLVVPVFTFLTSVLYLLDQRVERSQNRLKVVNFFSIYFILNLLIMVFWELKGQPVLQDFYYATYLIPSMFLALSGQFNVLLNSLNLFQFRLLIGGTIVIFVLPLASSYNSFSAIYSILPRFGAGILLLVTAIALALGFGLVRQPQKKSLAILAALIAFSWIAVDIRVIPPNEFYGVGKANDYVPYKKSVSVPYKKSDCFVAVFESVKTIQKFDSEANLRFWYNFNSPLSQLYHSIASAYLFWTQRLVNDKFPSLQELQYGISLNPNGAIAILSDEPDALQKANDSLSQVGLKAQLLSQQAIQAKDVAFTITFIKTQVKGLLASEPTALGKDFLNNWSKLNKNLDVVVDKTASSIQVVTNKSLFDWQLISPPIQVEPKAKYLLQLALQIEAEGAAVHVLGADQRTILATRNWCKTQTADYSQKQFILDTANNDKVFIVIGNYSACPYPLPTASTFQFKDLEIRRIQSVQESSDAS